MVARRRAASPAAAARPVSCAGTASLVRSSTVVALRYQVDSRARRARFGNSLASILPSAPDRAWPPGARRARCARSASPSAAGPADRGRRRSAGASSPRTGETTRNRKSTISGAGAEHASRTSARRRRARTAPPRRRRAPARRGTAAAEPPSSVADRRQQQRRRRAARRARAWSTQPSAGPDPAQRPHERGARRAAAAACSRTRAATMSPRVLPRATKNSALRAEQVEQRLREGERPQPAEVQRGAREAHAARDGFVERARAGHRRAAARP